jgi:hypothetical protein
MENPNPMRKPKRHKDHKKEPLRTSIEKTMKVNDSRDAFWSHFLLESMENPLEIQLEIHHMKEPFRTKIEKNDGKNGFRGTAPCTTICE